MVRERRSIRHDAKFEQRRYKITYIIIVSTSQADIDYLPQLRATESPATANARGVLRSKLPTINGDFPP